MRDILIKNGLIVTADDTLQAELFVVNGVIVTIGKNLDRSGAQVIDACGQ